MSDFTIEQLEHYKILMEPTPPFLNALIAEKRAHQKLRAEVEELRNSFTHETSEPHYEGDYGDGWHSGLNQATASLTRILEATDE